MKLIIKILIFISSISCFFSINAQVVHQDSLVQERLEEITKDLWSYFKLLTMKDITSKHYKDTKDAILNMFVSPNAPFQTSIIRKDGKLTIDTSLTINGYIEDRYKFYKNRFKITDIKMLNFHEVPKINAKSDTVFQAEVFVNQLFAGMNNEIGNYIDETIKVITFHITNPLDSEQGLIIKISKVLIKTSKRIPKIISP